MGRDKDQSRLGKTAPTLMIHRVGTGTFAFLVLVQAVLAGRFLNGQAGLIAAHRALGAQVLPSLSVLLLVVALLVRRYGVPPSGMLAVSFSLVVLTTLQTGLGFMGRTSTGAAGWHIPLGLAIFGLSVYQLSVVRRVS